jgi:diguanylate cyclase (GGDEF)-like protein
MELLLWRWSTAVQATSELMIAVFFVALAMTFRRGELRTWVGAWLANLGALLVTILFWQLQPQSPPVFALAVGAYIFAKTLFVLLLVNGIAAFTSVRPVALSNGALAGGVLLLSFLGAMAIRTVEPLGVAQSALIALGLGYGVVALVRAGALRHGWLIAGLALRTALAVAETIAYAVQWANGGAQDSWLSTFLASHSSFDTGAEWMIALGCVMTLHHSIQQELAQSNHELRAAQEELRDLLHRDQLTGVFNRRSLPTLLRQGQVTGATLLFFDLDDFKQINDRHGHHVGDECLVRFARVLQEHFLPGDPVLRYAGDEFIVITRLDDGNDIAMRLATVRRLLEQDRPRIVFSVGRARVPGEGDPDVALRLADEDMYAAKDGHALERA